MEERFSRFRRALRKRDQDLFDRLFRVARKQLQAGVMGANPNPFDSMAMTMMIDLQKQVDDLSTRVQELEHAQNERELEQEVGREPE